ncbi:MFS aflatoxin efflux [Fusarium oxysporum f. sp. phaseoli]
MLFKRKEKVSNLNVVPDGSMISTPHPDPAPDPAANHLENGVETREEGLERMRSTATQEVIYPSGIKLALLMISVFVSMFLVALHTQDRLIISTAIPRITDDFESVTDIGWYGSAYLLATCAFQLLFGKLYTFYSVKLVFLSTVALFEIGSAVCGAAPNSIALILGRTIAGVGSAGIFSGVIVIIVYAVPLHKRPLYQGIFGAVFGLASVIGPLVGGAFTSSKATWRWCFYINLPFGGIAMLFIFFLLHVPDRETTHLSTKSKLSQLDAVGTSVFVPGTVCLLLALQWGGLEYSWSNWHIILPLVLGGILLIAFVLVQIFMPETATVPPRIFVQRSIISGSFATLCIGSQQMIFMYFLPIWFQAIKGVSAVDSGIRLLPMVLSMVVASMITGILVSKIGYYTPFMIAGVCLMSVGAGLLTTLQVNTEQAKWVGYQFIYGWGLGSTFQAPNLAAQTVLPTRDVPIGTALLFFTQLLGGTIFISVGQNVLNNQLLERLRGVRGFDASFITSSGATTLTDLPDSIKPTVLFAYNEALRKVYDVGLILTCLTIFGALGMEWRSVKEKKQKESPVDKAKAGKDSELETETQRGNETDTKGPKSPVSPAEPEAKSETSDPEKEARPTSAVSMRRIEVKS